MLPLRCAVLKKDSCSCEHCEKHVVILKGAGHKDIIRLETQFQLMFEEKVDKFALRKILGNVALFFAIYAMKH